MVTEQSSHASLWRAECLYWPASSGMYSPHANSLQMPSAHYAQQCHPIRPDTHTHKQRRAEQRTGSFMASNISPWRSV